VENQAVTKIANLYLKILSFLTFNEKILSKH
jgi:hypothetical protein